MKLFWKDLITTLLVIAGGAIVYAKYYNYAWSGIQSWRGAVGWLAVVGLLMFLYSSFSFANRSILNVTEMVLGAAAIVLAVVGGIITSEAVFYSFAAVLGVLWLINIARHVRHSFIGRGTTPTHHHAHAH